MKNMIFISFALPCILESRGRLLQKTTERSIVSKNDDFKAVSITKHCLHGHEHHERKSRSSIEVSEAQNGTNIKRSVQKPRISLIKKPIPTYVEIDYEEDYQTRMVRWPEKYTESSENEDEDFSVDDYEFDVNHDEYITRGKPLEPRRKVKIGTNYNNTKLVPDFEAKSTSEKIKVINDEVVTSQNKIPKKREEIFVETTKKPK
ncbi:unnamed protein product [Parnassius apollo]|uniref:(apollo) hypothetical protein n=1 Tax=Parnassius apollo TaxID=110799 RepID=A0A8S3YA94_PARAO|nr:unnamed protein product [Parnassius apollo]